MLQQQHNSNLLITQRRQLCKTVKRGKSLSRREVLLVSFQPSRRVHSVQFNWIQAVLIRGSAFVDFTALRLPSPSTDLLPSCSSCYLSFVTLIAVLQPPQRQDHLFVVSWVINHLWTVSMPLSSSLWISSWNLSAQSQPRGHFWAVFCVTGINENHWSASWAYEKLQLSLSQGIQ